MYNVQCHKTCAIETCMHRNNWYTWYYFSTDWKVRCYFYSYFLFMINSLYKLLALLIVRGSVRQLECVLQHHSVRNVTSLLNEKNWKKKCARSAGQLSELYESLQNVGLRVKNARNRGMKIWNRKKAIGNKSRTHCSKKYAIHGGNSHCVDGRRKFWCKRGG